MMKSMLWFFDKYRDGLALTVTDGVGRIEGFREIKNSNVCAETII